METIGIFVMVSIGLLLFYLAGKIGFSVGEGWATSVPEGRCPAEISSNPNQTHLPVAF